VPLFSIPGLVSGGAYAGIYVLAMLIFLVPVGSIAGAVLGVIGSFQISKSSQKRIFGILIVTAYLPLIIGILMRTVVFGVGQKYILPIVKYA
jgi:hypothetical protein